MKTEQEQIKAIKQIIDERVETTLGQVQGRHDNVIKTVDTVIIARDIVEAGYGNVSEYKAEIKQLKAENEKMRKERGYINQLKEELLLKHYHVDCYQEEIKKQAKIDVLNELKTRHDYAIKNMGYPWDISQQIDKLIKEIEKGGESGRYDRHFTPNDNKLEIIVVKDLQEVEK